MSDLEEAVRSGEQARHLFEDDVVAAERAFAIRAAYDGIRTAFLAVLSEDSVICGEGPEPGRSAYEALPKDYPGRLMWEPCLVGASSDGTLAFTSGPYRSLDREGHETSTGIYFSIWRRHAGSGHLELVLDFGVKGAGTPAMDAELKRMSMLAKGSDAMIPFLQACMEKGQRPDPAEALRLGDPSCQGLQAPSGYHSSLDGELGALWGARVRADGTAGAYAMIFTWGESEPVPRVCLSA